MAISSVQNTDMEEGVEECVEPTALWQLFYLCQNVFEIHFTSFSIKSSSKVVNYGHFIVLIVSGASENPSFR